MDAAATMVEFDTRRPKAIPAGSVWERSGFGAAYAEHAQSIYYLALRLLGNPDLAEDATHDVFLKAFRKLGTFRGDSAIRTWLYRIAINHCRNLQQSWHQRTMLTNVDEAVFERGAARSESPLRILEIKELGQRIQQTLDALPDEYRLLLLLRADEQLSYEEIAELTGQTADAVRGKLHRARKAFAAAFTQSA
jgi:RNA polymerase sigma-70 factor (ECF subfamily)